MDGEVLGDEVVGGDERDPGITGRFRHRPADAEMILDVDELGFHYPDRRSRPASRPRRESEVRVARYLHRRSAVNDRLVAECYRATPGRAWTRDVHVVVRLGQPPCQALGEVCGAVCVRRVGLRGEQDLYVGLTAVRGSDRAWDS